MSLKTNAIRAEVHTDDFAYTAKFDATPFFAQADAASIVALAKCEWGGDYPADDVARFFEDRPGYDDVTEVFADSSRRQSGFECHVHDADALLWLKENRPDVLESVCAALDETAETILPVRVGTPYWDRDSSWTGDYQSDETGSAPSPLQ